MSQPSPSSPPPSKQSFKIAESVHPSIKQSVSPPIHANAAGAFDIEFEFVEDGAGDGGHAGSDSAEPDGGADEAEPPSMRAGSAGERIEPLIPWLRERFERVLVKANVAACTLSVAIVDDETMSSLHDEYLGDPTTTDVLTFDFAEAEDEHHESEPDAKNRTDPSQASPARLEGEIIICRDEAARQAHSHNHTTRDELLLYLVHGMLHLQGHDDHDEADARRMHLREDELITAIGMPPIYSSEASS